MSEKFCSALVAFSVGFSYPPATLPLRKIYFDKAVLNVNPITPFGGQAAFNSLTQPSVKLVPGTKDQTAPMACGEIVISQMQSVEANLGTQLNILYRSLEPSRVVRLPIRLHRKALPSTSPHHRPRLLRRNKKTRSIHDPRGDITS